MASQTNLSFPINAHSSGSKLVENFVDHLDLGIVISGTEGT